MSFTKKASEEYFRYHDFTPWLNESETLSNPTVAVSDKKVGQAQESMVSDVSVYGNKKVLYKIKGGVSGQTYIVSIKIDTSNGQKFEDTIDCEVV